MSVSGPLQLDDLIPINTCPLQHSISPKGLKHSIVRTSITRKPSSTMSSLDDLPTGEDLLAAATSLHRRYGHPKNRKPAGNMSPTRRGVVHHKFGKDTVKWENPSCLLYCRYGAANHRLVVSGDFVFRHDRTMTGVN